MHCFEEIKSLPDLFNKLEAEKVPVEEYRKYVNQFIRIKARKNNIPISGLFELTPLCNLDCKMCYVHLTSNQLVNKSLLTVDEWKNLMKQAIDAGMMSATLSGGECLIYPGFDELYLYLLSQGVKVSIKTNGLLLDEHRIEFFQKNTPQVIQISLYGSSEEAYEKVTGRRVFSDVMKNIRNAKEAGLILRVVITPSRFMEDSKSIVDLLRNEHISISINPNLFDPRQETGRSGKDLDQSIESYIDLYKYAYNLQEKDSILKDCTDSEDAFIDKPESNIGLRCGAGRFAFDIDWKGQMLACINLRDIVAYPLETSFCDSWKTINERVKSYVLPIECDSCKYYKKCHHCVANHCKAPIGHVDENYCKMVKQIIASGLL